MYKWIFAIFCTAILSLSGLAQGSGSSVQLTGSNYINVDSSYRFLSNPISFTCWVKRSNIDFGNMFMSSYYAGGYSGISAQITPSGQFAISYGDGTGFNSSDRKSVISSSAHLFQNVWVHCAFVNLSSTSGVIYINGVLVASFNDGSGGAWFQSATGNGAIGIHSGDLGIYYHVGELDDMTIWNKALTATEVRNMVCRNANGASSQLLGYYNFDTQVAGQVFDSSPNGNDGTFVGSVLMPLSAAAIGDTSYYSYSTSSVASFSQTLATGHQVEVAAITTNTKGVQVYEVFSAPNSTSGIPASSVVTDYFGVFLAVTDNTTKSFQLKVNNWNASKQLYKRDANNDLTWVPVSPSSVTGSTAAFPADQFRQEYAIVGSQNCRLDLGPDLSTCAPLNIWVKDLFFHPTKTYTWSTGAVADSILITSPLQLIVQMDSAGCVLTDSINIIEKIVSVNLGKDTTICAGDAFWIKDLNFHPSKTYTWSTGVAADSVLINAAQIVFVSVDSAGCTALDSIEIQTVNYPPPVFVAEIEKCVEEPLVYTFPTGNYTFLWDGGSTSNTTTIYTQTQLSFYTISPCQDSTLHTVNVVQNVCDAPCDIFVPNAFTPNDDTKNDFFEIGINCFTTSFSIKIFNRWGDQVYESNDPYFKWDGTYKNRFLSDGVYAYILTYSGFDKVVQSKHGLITLIR